MESTLDPNNEVLAWAFLVLILPLVSFVIQALLPNKSAHLCSIFSSLILALITFLSVLIVKESWTDSYFNQMDWFTFGDFTITVGLSINRWAAIMLLIVSLISLLVNVFSIEYMKGDEGYKRYFAILSLFTFSMIGIIISDSLFIIFIFWELVGLSSYLLIGHWFQKNSAAKASKKAFIVNRIGDIGFLVALALCWRYFNTFSLAEIQHQLTEIIAVSSDTILPSDLIPAGVITALGITLFIAAVGKSAQFPLQVWLPDAMEGPTPVSALIHAATMVAAGVYLLSRVFFLLNIDALTLIAVTGSITAFMGAFAAFNQHDIKKVLAFSTISQLGFMVVGLGAGAHEAALFHLFTHAFFKAGLFLAAGAIIHYIHKANPDNFYNAQDMRLMGGLRKKLPITFIAYTLFSFALIGLPLFSGFLSKEAILIGVLDGVTTFGGAYYFVTLLTFVSVAFTAFYVIRQLLLLFFDSYRGDNETAISENSLIMKGVLIFLAIFSIGFVWSINPFDIDLVWLLSNFEGTENFFVSFNASGISHTIISIASIGLIFTGGIFAWLKYKPGSTLVQNYKEWSPNDHSMFEHISFNNWYLNAVYQKLIIDPLIKVSSLFSQIEQKIIDRIVNLSGIVTVVVAHIVNWFDRALVDGAVNASAYLVGRTGLLTKSVQGGRVQSYIIWAVIGLLIILFLAL